MLKNFSFGKSSFLKILRLRVLTRDEVLILESFWNLAPILFLAQHFRTEAMKIMDLAKEMLGKGRVLYPFNYLH